MELGNLEHDFLQWGAFAGVILGIWRVWAMLNKSIAEKVHIERDIEELKKGVNRLDERKGQMFAKLDSIEDRLARIETKLETTR